MESATTGKLRRLRSIRRSLLGVALSMTIGAVSLGMVHAAAYHPPRTSTGAPDLQGYWTNFTRTPLQRPAGVTKLILSDAEAKALETKLNDQVIRPKDDQVGQGQSEWYPEGSLARIGGQARTSWIIDPADGQIPYTPQAKTLFNLWRDRMNGDFDDPEDRPPPERCLMGSRGSNGPPMLTSLYQPFYRIVQTANVVAIEAEMDHDVRIVRLGGTHLPAAITPWMGDSIGHWEGDTLVVETTNFNPGEAFRVQLLISTHTRITERFTRISPTQMLYQFKVEDPTIYTSAWSGEAPFRSAPGPLLEYACAEGNYSMAGVLAGAREQEAKAAASAAVKSGAP
jgi:hypothetical protein